MKRSSSSTAPILRLWSRMIYCILINPLTIGILLSIVASNFLTIFTTPVLFAVLSLFSLHQYHSMLQVDSYGADFFPAVIQRRRILEKIRSNIWPSPFSSDSVFSILVNTVYWVSFCLTKLSDAVLLLVFIGSELGFSSFLNVFFLLLLLCFISSSAAASSFTPRDALSSPLLSDAGAS